MTAHRTPGRPVDHLGRTDSGLSSAQGVTVKLEG